MSDVLPVRAEGIGKRYQIGGSNAPYETLRDALAVGVRSLLRRSDGSPPRHFWALRDVSFEVAQGEVVGIIGRNGAGKSTLLKILSQVTTPTTGRAVVRGRMGALLEVGTGFHPELTGRENTYLNGSILGMSRAEIRERFDEIVEFAEIGPFLDTPVKRYSSGMYLRLAFSIAAHVSPDILAVDEVLAVGDAAFQKRCLGRIRGIAREEGRTVLFVSHNLQAIEALCTRAIFLRAGRIAFDGPVSEAVSRYLRSVEQDAGLPLDERPDRTGDGAIRLTSVTARNAGGVERTEFVAGEPMAFDFSYRRSRVVSGLNLGFTVYNQLGMACTHFNTSAVDYRVETELANGRITCRVDRLPFPVGDYTISALVTTDDGVADLIPGCLRFRVVASRFFPAAKVAEPDLVYCPVLVDHRWSSDAG